SLAITPTNDVNFTLGVAATTRDAEGNLSTTTTATEAVTVNPLAPSVAPVAASGLEGASIALNLGTTAGGLAGDANALATLVVSAIPLGATLSDGTHTFTASAGNTSVDVHSWNLASLAITPTNDVNFTLSVAATAKDAEGNLSTTTTASERASGSALAPTLAHVAASTGNAAADVHGWNLPGLAITPTSDANFTLSVAATTKDAEGNLSTTTTASEAVTVNPLAPTLAPVATGGIE